MKQVRELHWTPWLITKVSKMIEENAGEYDTFDKLYNAMPRLEYGGLVYRIIKGEIERGEEDVTKDVRDLYNQYRSLLVDDSN